MKNFGNFFQDAILSSLLRTCCRPFRAYSITLLLAIVSPHLGFAQWSLVTPNLLGALNTQEAALRSEGGIVWAGYTQLYMSLDDGSTWVQRSPSLFSGDYITDINFYDASNGLVGTYDGSILLTRDQGVTWNEVHRTSSCLAVTFCGSPNSFIVTTGGEGTIESSIDGGTTWSVSTPDRFVSYVESIGGANALALAGSVPGASVFLTTNSGQSWQRKPSFVDFDSYAFGVDPCSDSLVYVVNEEGSTPSNGISELFVTSDQGASWVSHGGMPRPFYSGSISVSSNALYCQTVQNGIFRSTDFGQTWSTIGGPSAPYDTRLVCALNDNLILAIDANGSVWRTRNSGGDTVHGTARFTSLSITPFSLFDNDTLLPCDQPDTAQVVLTAKFCSAPGVLSQLIAGPDSADYHLVRQIGPVLTGADTVLISFQPTSSGVQSGSLNITLENGTVIPIPLHGVGKGANIVSLGTFDVSTDTVGGSVEVPIIIHGDSSIPALECSFQFDTSILVYHGTFTSDSTQLDEGAINQSGKVKIRVDSATLAKDSTIGFAIFAGFPLGNPCTTVTFDSINVLDPNAPCSFTPYGSAVATVCLAHGCGVATLSNFMRYHAMPTVSVFPNPARNQLSVVASDTLNANLQIVNVLGFVVRLESLVLAKHALMQLDISEIPRGKYFLRVSSGEYVQTVPFVVE